MSFLKKEFSLTNRWVFYSISAGLIILLILIALPNFIPSQDESCGEVTSVPANMHTVQTLVETYAVDWGGFYPDSINLLEKEAKKEPHSYWKTFENPLTGYSGSGQSYTDEGQKTQAGIVTYQLMNETSYRIFGYDKNNQKIQRKGEEYYLTNM